MLAWQRGDLVWAKFGGWPWWPGVVSGDRRTKSGSEERIVFVDRVSTHAWINHE